MTEPQGFNPVGDHAPGLPQHDRRLPGHVSGTSAWPVAEDFTADTPKSFAGSGLPLTYAENVFGKWFARMITLVAIFLSLPIQMALYPIAGATALTAGGAVYLLTNGAVDRETVLDWTWFGAFAGFLPAMRFENDLTDRMPKFRTGKHVLRLLLVGVATYWYDASSKGSPPRNALVVAVALTVIMHFVLRGSLTMGLWRALLATTWLRSSNS